MNHRITGLVSIALHLVRPQSLLLRANEVIE